MIKFSAPSQQKTYTTLYQGFRGVDYSTDAALIDNRRSPYAPNLIADAGGNPEKRPGWRTLETLTGEVYGIFPVVLGDDKFFLVHAGETLYRWEEGETATQIYSGMGTKRGSVFVMNQKAFILSGTVYLVYDGQTARPVSEVATIPTTVIGRSPEGTGGTSFEPVNLLTGKRKNSFLTTGTNQYYDLDNVISKDDPAKNAIKEGSVTAQKLSVDGAWNTIEPTSVNYSTGKVYFSTSPGATPITGQDNVIITYEKEENEADVIHACTSHVFFGVGGKNRIFATGNPSKKNYDFHSYINDPTYFPDTHYTRVGSDSTAIMGYCRLGEYFAIVKEDNGQDSTIYLRSAQMAEDDAIFPIKQGATGIGAISPRAFENLLDEPLFLSATGVYGLRSGDVSALSSVQNRSYFIDAKLTQEENLSEAVAAVWNGYYILAINGKCYLLDGKQDKTYREMAASNYVYECYEWNNIPASCLCSVDGSLYFGTKAGQICKFNTDQSALKRYNDDGVAIYAAWATKMDDEGDFTRYKKLKRYGTGVLIKPYTRSSVTMKLKTESGKIETVRRVSMDNFAWECLDFSRLAFLTSTIPQMNAILTTIRQYGSLQIIVENNETDEGFGVYGIIKRYCMGNMQKH